MTKKFTLLLMGPAGSGKSAFVAGLSKLDIFPYITAKNQGGANTTKIATTYEFTNQHDEFRITACETVEGENSEEIFSELQQLISEDDGIQKVFDKINDAKFAKKCTSITIELPCKDQLIPENVLYDTIVVRDSRGFGDVDDINDTKTDDLGVTKGVNAIIFTSISSFQQPAIFSKIIDEVMAYNVKTPMFLLRRDADLTQNDQNFEESIINNISKADQQLNEVITSMDTLNLLYKINRFVFNVPEVKSWKGVLGISPEQTQHEITTHSEALKEILHYSMDMYERLYKVIVEKLQGEYQEQFVEEILNELISEEAFEVAARIANYPTVAPQSYYAQKSRDTEAFAYPVQLCVTKDQIGEEPYRYEMSRNGNGNSSAIIPSYSYACFNFRNIFRSITARLTTDPHLSPLFSTFLDIVLEDATIESTTGYTNRICQRDAFNFNLIVETRNKCTDELLKHQLADELGNWKSFSYKPFTNQYENYEAIAVLIYKNLIDSLGLSKNYEKFYRAKLQDKGSVHLETLKQNEIHQEMQRS